MHFPAFQHPAVALADAPAAAPSASVSPSPSATPDVLSQTIDIEGTAVPLHDIAGITARMMGLFIPMKDAHPTAVFIVKPKAAMPASDPNLFFAGSQIKDGQPVITIWASDALHGVSTLGTIQMVAFLGLLDAGQGGSALQSIYAKQRAADAALPANAPDTWVNRRDMALRLVVFTDMVMKSDPGTPMKYPQ